MSFTLPESSPRRQRSAAGTALSVALHAVAIGATIAATGMSAQRPVPAPTPEALAYVETKEPPELRTPSAVDRRRPPARQQPDIARSAIEPIERVEIAIPVTVVPSQLPDLGESLASLEGQRPVVADPGTGAGGVTVGSGAARSEPLTALAVDRAVVVRGSVSPRYPAMLAGAGIEGAVRARFVVDTLGRVERASIETTVDGPEAFARSVREALARMRFVPAEVAGQKVRQLAEQSFDFRITRR